MSLRRSTASSSDNADVGGGGNILRRTTEEDEDDIESNPLAENKPPPRKDMFNQAMKMPSEFKTFKQPSTFASEEETNSVPANAPSSPRWRRQRVHLPALVCPRPACPSFLLLSASVLGAAFAILAILLHLNIISIGKSAAIGEVQPWQWFAFCATLVLALPFAHSLVKLIQYILWRAHASWTLIAYYYFTICSRVIKLVLACSVLVAAWHLLVINPTPGLPSGNGIGAYWYVTQVFWWLLVTAALFCLSGLAMAFAALYFERTTYWTRVNECARIEYMILKLLPKRPRPHAAVLHLHEVGEEETKADPLVLRKLTRYIKKKHLIAYCDGCAEEPGDEKSSVIDVFTAEDFQDLGQVLFAHFYLGHDNVLGEIGNYEASNTRARLASLKALRRSRQGGDHATAGFSSRALFTPLHNAAPTTTSTNKRFPASAAAATAHSSNSSASSAGETHAAHLPLLRTLGKANSSFKLPPKTRTPTAAPVLAQNAVMKRLASRNNSLPQSHFEARYAALFPGETREEALVCWETLFDPMKSGKTSVRAMRALFSRLHTERVGLGDTLKDSEAAIDRLGTVCDAVAFICSLVALALLLSGGQSYDVWIGLTSFLVTLAVIFGSSATQVVENLIFMFFRHPFDVGDLLLYEQSYYSVRKIELLTTTFIRWNGEYSQIPNAKLAALPICNLSRSGLHWELIEAYVDVVTCTEQFMQRLTEYMTAVAVANPESYSGKVQIICRAFDRPLLIKILAYVEFSYCPVNLTRLFEDIGRVHQSFAEALRKNGATESGVGVAAIRADGQTKPIPFLIPAAGLVYTPQQNISLAMGL